ncbi:MAG: hypothetical protein ACYDHY_07700 [Acidiferrobacterales bacterium]
MRNDRHADQIISEYFQRIKEGPQVASDPLDSQATGGTIGEALKPEQAKLAKEFTKKILAALDNCTDGGAKLGVNADRVLEDLLHGLILASEKAEGEDTSDVEI